MNRWLIIYPCFFCEKKSFAEGYQLELHVPHLTPFGTPHECALVFSPFSFQTLFLSLALFVPVGEFGFGFGSSIRFGCCFGLSILLSNRPFAISSLVFCFLFPDMLFLQLFFSLNRIWSPHFISRLNRIDSSRIESKFKSAKNRIGFFFMWWQRFNKEQRIGSQKLRRSDRKCRVVNVWKSCISKSTNVLSIFPSYFTDQAMAWHGMASNIFQMARRNGFSIHTHPHFYLCINCNILWFTNQ